jgi:hypothetical protein
MTSAIAKELPPYRLDTVNSRHAGTVCQEVRWKKFLSLISRADIASGRVRTRHPISTFESHLPSTIACGRGRRDTPGNEKWSGRWESNTPLGTHQSFRIMALQARLSAACDYGVKNDAIPANASQCGLC